MSGMILMNGMLDKGNYRIKQGRKIMKDFKDAVRNYEI